MTNVILRGSERTAVRNATVVAPSDPTERLEVSLILRRRDRESLRSRVSALVGGDRTAGLLSRDQFAAAHGADANDITAVQRFAAAHGLIVVQESAARRTVVLAGTVAQFDAAFSVRLEHVAHPGGTYRGRSGAIQLPAELAGIIEAVLGLDNRPQAKPHFRIRPTMGNVNWRVATAGLSSFTPPQVASLYQFPPGTGAGQCVAIIELGGGYRPEDLDAYFNSLNVGSPKVCVVGVDHGQNAPTGDPNGPDGEVMLDIEVVGAIAPAANIVVYFAPNTDAGFLDAITTAIHDSTNKPSILSISWGGPESSWTAQAMTAMDEAFQAAAALGITVCVASGDNGSSDGVDDGGDHVDFPASSPHVLACGGTKLDASATAISTEVVWNEGTTAGASGGGISTFFPLPAWQAGVSVLKANGAPVPLSMRGVPDVCANADPATGYAVRIDGTQTVIGGTSAVAPLWAALAARINQASRAPLGFMNPALYASPAALSDITSGHNGDYDAATGWDACTGLGSPEGSRLQSVFAAAVAATPLPVPVLPSLITPTPRLTGDTAAATSAAPLAPSPFDPKAAAFYGQFVQAAYSMYDADPSNLTPAPSADFPGGYTLAAWVQMQDFIIGSTGPVFYGLIAQSVADASRFVLAIRGTSNGVEWWDNANAIVRRPFKVPGCGSVGAGFARIYDTLQVIERTPAGIGSSARALRAAGGFSAQVAALVKGRAATLRPRDAAMGPSASVEITGHSLGGALATLYTLDNSRTDQLHAPMICTFASPFVGDGTFASAFNALGLTSWRVVNQPDIVPKIPPEILGFTHINSEQLLNSTGKVKSSVGCWHSLSTYLSLLDPSVTVESGCQLTSTAPSLAQRAPAPAAVAPVPAAVPAVNVTINIGSGVPA